MNPNANIIKCCLFFVFVLFGWKTQCKTYAIIIGVSDYFYINKLNFAHNDATAFQHFLTSQMKENELHLRVHIDGKARIENIRESLHTINLLASPKDTVIFFFSGHGKQDVVQPEITNFLPYEASDNDFSTIALGSNVLEDFSRKLRYKGVEVIMFIDACRAGTFTEKNYLFVNSALQNTTTHEIKFFSCTVNQKSVEKSSLGGGHGVFTYYLLEGLNGACDSDANCKINVEELRRYLYDEVRAETNDQQAPICICADYTVGLANLANCTPQILTQKSLSKFQRPHTEKDKKKSREKVIKAFEQALSEKKLLNPKDSSANYYYQQFQKIKPLDTIQAGIMKIRLVNELAKSSKYGLLDYLNHERRLLTFGVCDTIVNYLSVAVELLGADDILTPDFESQLYFFQGLRNYFTSKRSIESAIASFIKSLQYKDNTSYVYNAIGNTYLSRGDIDSAEDYYQKASSFAPNWKIPKGNLEKVKRVRQKNDEYEEESSKQIASSSIGGSPVFFVKEGGSGDGSSWSDATGDLQYALKNAKHGSAIWVAKGTYKPTSNSDRMATFMIPSGVRVVGGFSGSEYDPDSRELEKNPTILSGEIGDPNVSEDNSYTVVYFDRADSRTLIDGFIIENGYSNGTGDRGDFKRAGAGIFNNGSDGVSSPFIQNCIFRNNYGRDGAAIYNYGTGGEASASIIYCEFAFNKADLEGGAIHNDGTNGICNTWIRGCRFVSNEASFGASIHNDGINGQVELFIQECTFSGNTAYIKGSVVYSVGQSTPIMVDCDFADNMQSMGNDVEYFPTYSAEKNASRSDIKLSSGD